MQLSHYFLHVCNIYRWQHRALILFGFKFNNSTTTGSLEHLVLWEYSVNVLSDDVTIDTFYRITFFSDAVR